MISDLLTGLLAASVTPANADGSIDKPAVKRLMAYYAENGLRGALLPSSTGESFAMPYTQRMELVETACQDKHGLSVLANCSEHNMKDALRDIAIAKDKGADIAVCMPPQFLEYTQEELRDYFYKIADESPLPIVVYNHLVRLNNKISLDCLIELSKHGNIIGIKDTHNDPNRMLQLYARGVNEDFAILAGGDGVAGYSALLGMEMLNALSPVKPLLFKNLYAAGKAGDIKLVGCYQLEVNKLAKLFSILKGGQGSSTLFAQSIKIALSLKGLCGTNSIMLGYKAEDADIEKVRALVDSVKETL